MSSTRDFQTSARDYVESSCCRCRICINLTVNVCVVVEVTSRRYPTHCVPSIFHFVLEESYSSRSRSRRSEIRIHWIHLSFHFESKLIVVFSARRCCISVTHRHDTQWYSGRDMFQWEVDPNIHKIPYKTHHSWAKDDDSVENTKQEQNDNNKVWEMYRALLNDTDDCGTENVDCIHW